MPPSAFASAPLRTVLLLALAVQLLGCIQPETMTYDLVHSLPAAQAVEPMLRVDFGHAGSRPALLSGWSWNETADDGTHFVWATGGASSLRLQLNGLRPDEVRLRIQPFAAAFSPDVLPSLELAVGGTKIAQVELEPGFAEYRLAVDPTRWPEKDVVLSLLYRPAPPPAGGGRRLAVAWDWLELGFAETREPAPPDPPRARGTKLELAPGARIDYSLDLEAGSRFEVDAIEPSPDSLILVLEPASEGPRTLRLEGEAAVDLEIEHFTTATLSLLADPRMVPETKLLLLNRPRIVVNKH